MPLCLVAPHSPLSVSGGGVIDGRAVQNVVLLWGSALDPLSDHVPPEAVGQGDHVLHVAVVHLH